MGIGFSLNMSPTESKRRKTDNRDNPIDEKRMFFIRRHSDPHFGSHFECLDDKEVCNPSDRENRFYLKIGGVTVLQRKEVPGKRIRTSAERLKESEFYGSYVYIGDIDRRIRTLLYARKKGLPQHKLVSIPGTLHNVIPRFDPKDGEVIIGIRIVNEQSYHNRKWTRFDCPTDDSPGFFEIKSLGPLKTEIGCPLFAIYVPKNTSLLMVDVTQQHLYADNSRNYIYTLFQEGAIISFKTNLFFCFYDIDEGQEYDGNSMYANKRYLLNESKNLENLLTKANENRMEDKKRIIFLKSASNHTFWTLRVTKLRGQSDDMECQLCIPTGGQFEDILPWSEGLKVVRRRHSRKPWNKYIERETTEETQIKDITDTKQAYPSEDEEYIDFRNIDFEDL